MDSLAAAGPFAQQRSIRTALDYLSTLSPILLLVSFAVTFILHSVVSAKNAKKTTSNNAAVQTGPGGRPLPKRMRSAAVVPAPVAREFSPKVKLLFKWLSVGVMFTFVVDATVNILHALFQRRQQWWCGQSTVVYVIGSFFAYSVILISLIDTKPSPTFAHFTPWALDLPVQLAILTGYLTLYTNPHREPIVGNPFGGPLRSGMTSWEAMGITSLIIRILFIFTLVLFYTFGSMDKTSRMGDHEQATERTRLLDSEQSGVRVNGNGYGAPLTNGKDDNQKPAEAAWVRPNIIPSTSWWEYLSGYSLFLPYLWPSKSRRLQLTVVVCIVLVMLQRVVNVLVPYQVGKITNALSGDGEKFYIPWDGILLYCLYRWLQGSQGLIGSFRGFLWIPISQYSYMELSTAAFEHVHSLSLDFHLGKKTGEVLSALSKGSSINTFLEQVTFQVVPMLIDLCVAVVYFMFVFDVYYALVIAIVTFIYLYVTVRMASWRANIRRQMVNASRQEDAVKNDSMVSYETVKYFNAEQYEFGRYRGAVTDFQDAEYTVLMSLNLMNTCQNTVFTLGLLIACFIAAFQVAQGQQTVGKFVTLLTYMAQLQAPLNFFGTFYRSMQSALINSERMLELFREQPTVLDGPLARELPKCHGDIKFENVEFAYDTRKPALNGLSFHCAPGSTTALVGESGGGKSTVFRLLFRFYNATAGKILVDGNRADHITIDSLRRHIGVVPQDTVLFNETLMYNLKYANPTATNEDVYEACRAASIHDRIMTFPDGYQTKVGERGLRLSGGEKQRVAIARTILKNPRIILLDEATAALDTETEEHIQGALSTLSKGRTMLVIAHRLSTITTADQILVLHNGQVAEKGTHEQLLALKGRYASMWRKQIRAQRAAAEAQVLQNRAQRLRSASVTGTAEDSSSQSDEDRNANASARPSRPPMHQRSTKASDSK